MEFLYGPPLSKNKTLFGLPPSRIFPPCSSTFGGKKIQSSAVTEAKKMHKSYPDLHFLYLREE
jgi:hypothetical protein